MKPLVMNEPAPTALFWGCAGAWLIGELLFAARTTLRDPEARDPSFLALTALMLAGLALGALASAQPDAAALPGPGWWPLALGLALFAAGIALRVRAIRELGRFFKYTVVIAGDHAVVDTGPYRLTRHPSYTGLLLAMLGLGVALGSWLSIAACLLPPLVGFSVRLLREERALAETLGEPYREYMRRTWRLVPHLW
jgi:protein-S-isoprenylcysteine O-methyltransferase Ste14